MAIKIGAHGDDKRDLVEVFNRRMREAGSSWGFYVEPVPRWIPKRTERQSAWRELYLAMEDDRAVVGGFALKPQRWLVRGEERTVTDWQGRPWHEAVFCEVHAGLLGGFAGVASHLPALAAEWQALARGRAQWAGSPYPPVFVTVDAVIRCQGRVLLIRRGQAPGLGLLAVPGGFLEQRDTVYQSAVRELEEETGLAMLEPALRQCLKAVTVFDRPEKINYAKMEKIVRLVYQASWDLAQASGRPALLPIAKAPTSAR